MTVAAILLTPYNAHLQRKALRNFLRSALAVMYLLYGAGRQNATGELLKSRRAAGQKLAILPAGAGFAFLPRRWYTGKNNSLPGRCARRGGEARYGDRTQMVGAGLALRLAGVRTLPDGPGLYQRAAHGAHPAGSAGGRPHGAGALLQGGGDFEPGGDRDRDRRGTVRQAGTPDRQAADPQGAAGLRAARRADAGSQL